jgi:hypothetical protein
MNNISNYFKEKFNFKKYTEKDLSDAIEFNLVDKVEFILKRLPERQFQYNYCTYCAIKNYTEIIKILLKDIRCIPQNNLNEPLTKSIEYNNFEAFKLLVSDVRVLNSFNEPMAIDSCISKHNYDALHYLLNTININPFNNKEYDYCPLGRSLLKKNKKIINEIINDKNFSIKYYPHEEIVKYRDMDIYKILIEIKKIPLTDLFREYCYLKSSLDSCLEIKNIKTLKYLFNIPELQTQLKHDKIFYSKIKASLMQNKIGSF